MSIVLFRSYHIWNVFYSFLFLPGIYQIHRHLVRRLYFGRNVVKSSDFSWQALSWPVEPHFGHFRVAFKWRFKLYSQWKSTELSPISTFQAKDPLDAIIPQRTCTGKFKIKFGNLFPQLFWPAVRKIFGIRGWRPRILQGFWDY